MRLLLALATGLMLFIITLVVYGVGILIGACTWSDQLVTIVALNNLMVSAVLWMFWD